VDTIIASTGAPNLGLHTSSVQAALGGGVRSDCDNHTSCVGLRSLLIDHRRRVAGEVDEQPLAGHMDVPHRHR
jgi:hypothetical protein